MTKTKTINWDEYYQELAPKIKGICYRYVSDKKVAEDLTHDTFLRAMEKISGFSGRGSLEGWILKIAVNNALQHLRKNSERTVLIEKMKDSVQKHEDELQSTNATGAAIEQSAFTLDELLQVLDNLPEHHRLVFNLYVLDGFRHKQIGEMLGISAGTSKSHLARARKKARQILKQKLENKENYRSKRYLLWMLLLFPNRINAIYKQLFRNYKIPVSTILNGSNTASLPVSFFTPVLVASITAIAIITITGAYMLIKPSDNEQVQKDLIIETIQEEQIRNQDSISKDNSENLNTFVDTVSISEPKNIESNKPVVVHKTIVLRDTVRMVKSEKD